MSDPVRRVAVTGAAGYVASGMIRRLEGEDTIERILATDIRPLRTRRTAKVVFQQHDVTTPMADMLRQNGIEAVVHLAYVMNPGHDRNAVQRVNVSGTANVLDSCAQAGVRHVIYLSSTSVYGAHPDNPSLLTEDSPLRPVKGFQYSEDKVRSEALIDEFAQRHPTVTATVLRTCPVMGPSADNFIARAFTKPFLVGIRGYDPPLQFLHEDDLTDVMWRCLLNRVSGVYNVAGDGAVRWSEAATMFGRRLISLPAPLLYGLVGAAWGLRLQRDSPACGLDMIRYPWTVTAEKIQQELGVRLSYSSKDAWTAFVQRQDQPAPVNEAQG